MSGTGIERVAALPPKSVVKLARRLLVSVPVAFSALTSRPTFPLGYLYPRHDSIFATGVVGVIINEFVWRSRPH